MTQAPDQAIYALADAWPAWREQQGLVVGSCILAARVGQEVLAYFGHRAEPMPVAAGILSPVVAAYADAHPDEVITLEKVVALGGHSIGTDPGSTVNGRGWNCHMLLHLPERRTVLDLTLDQYNRPAHDINLDALVGFYEGDEAPTEFLFSKAGCRIYYRQHPEQTSYRQAPDWRRAREAGIGTLIRTVRAMIKETAS